MSGSSCSRVREEWETDRRIGVALVVMWTCSLVLKRVDKAIYLPVNLSSYHHLLS